MDKFKKINICIIRNDKMGDMILTFPIIKAIKLSYPNSNIVVICSNTNSFLCEEAPFIDKYYVLDKKSNLNLKLKTFIKFSRLSFDLIFNFNQTIETFFLLLIGNSRQKSTLIYLSRYGNSLFSKLFQRITSKILDFNFITIDRKMFFENKLNFHQTEMMYQLVKKKIEVTKPKSFYLIPSKKNKKRIFQKRILIHLSHRWIDEKYSEGLFFKLLRKIEKKFGRIYLSTDEMSFKKFKKVYQSFQKYNNTNLDDLKTNDKKIIILDRLNFENWRNAILNSKLVITYECGCVHVASMLDVPLLVVYDYKNKPKMIHEEYSPLTDKYEKVIANQNQINTEIMLKLKKLVL